MPERRKESELPLLLVVPTGQLVLHEAVDEQRSMSLLARMREDEVLKNPPIVAPVDDNTNYVVLDGANRVTVACMLGLPHMLVQVVSYADVELDSWGHLVTGISPVEFTARVMRLTLQLASSKRLFARQLLEERKVTATLSLPDGSVYVLRGGGGLGVEVQNLCKLVNAYEGLSIIHRVKTDRLADLLPYYDNVAALVRFPRYTPNEILHLAMNGYKLPAGITRHIIQRRALRVNIPFTVLRDPSLSTEQKNAWLGEWLKERLARRAIRYYQESTFLFDE